MHPSKTIKGTNKGINGNKPLKKGIFKRFFVIKLLHLLKFEISDVDTEMEKASCSFCTGGHKNNLLCGDQAISPTILLIN